jgi:putative transposase
MASFNRFSPGEIYHCFSRGVDKRTTFESLSDYQRFIQLLYICNNEKLLQRSSLYKLKHGDVFDLPRDGCIVSIGAYSLLPNHFHLLLQEIKEGGISLFMSRLGNSYTKYFNIKNKRNGNLFVKPFRSKHVSGDQHYSHIVQYIHINPAEIFEPKLKDGVISNIVNLEKSLKNYQHSSLPDYLNINRPEKAILDENFTNLLSVDLSPLLDTLNDSAEYYSTIDLSGQEI